MAPICETLALKPARLRNIPFPTLFRLRTSSMQITLDTAVLETLLNHAASAARLVGHLDDAIAAAGPLADHIDAIACELSELLGNPHPVPSVRPSYDDDEPTEARPCPALPPRKQLAGGAQ
jgi:hypothetical protein